MSWKGIKRAAARTPHMMVGTKSNDAIFESLEKEFVSAIAAIDKIITESKNFRDSWTKLLTHQLEIPTQWIQIYSPVPGEGSSKTYYATPQSTLDSIGNCKDMLSELNETLFPILNGLDSKVVEPSMDMKKSLEQVQKLVRKRHHKKMDYDRFTQSVEKMRNKKDKTEKDHTVLQKMEGELETATQEFQMHDERLTEMLPKIVDSISRFFGPMLETMYALQMDLYQHLYASVCEYATSQGLTNIEDVEEKHQALYDPIRIKAETEIKSLRDGKIAKTPFGEPTSRPGLFTRKSSGPIPPRPTSSKPATTPPMAPEPRKPSIAAQTLTPPAPTFPSVGNGHALHGSSRTTSSSSISSDVAKKRPPPPPPPKPSISPKPEIVTAKYDFGGESTGDLPFRVGDRIKVIQKTDSLEDWWEGELNGQRGMFPRNYCA